MFLFVVVVVASGCRLIWLQDRDPGHQDTFGDGLYQTWVATRNIREQEQNFTCHVGHHALVLLGGEPGEPSGSGTLDAVCVGASFEEGPSGYGDNACHCGLPGMKLGGGPSGCVCSGGVLCE